MWGCLLDDSFGGPVERTLLLVQAIAKGGGAAPLPDVEAVEVGEVGAEPGDLERRSPHQVGRLAQAVDRGDPRRVDGRVERGSQRWGRGVGHLPTVAQKDREDKKMTHDCCDDHAGSRVKVPDGAE